MPPVLINGATHVNGHIARRTTTPWISRCAGTLPKVRMTGRNTSANFKREIRERSRGGRFRTLRPFVRDSVRFTFGYSAISGSRSIVSSRSCAICCELPSASWRSVALPSSVMQTPYSLQIPGDSRLPRHTYGLRRPRALGIAYAQDSTLTKGATHVPVNERCHPPSLTTGLGIYRI